MDDFGIVKRCLGGYHSREGGKGSMREDFRFDTVPKRLIGNSVSVQSMVMPLALVLTKATDPE